MRSCVFAVLLWVVAGCASSATSEARFGNDRYRETVRITGGDGQVMTTEVGRGGTTVRSIIPAPVNDVWAQLPAAYEAMALEINSADPRARILGFENLRTKSIDGSRPSRFLDCGQGVTGANADAYDINLSMLAQVLPTEDGRSEVHVMVEAVARNLAHGGAVIGCGSNGRLEERLFEVVQGLLSG